MIQPGDDIKALIATLNFQDSLVVPLREVHFVLKSREPPRQMHHFGVRGVRVVIKALEPTRKLHYFGDLRVDSNRQDALKMLQMTSRSKRIKNLSTPLKTSSL